MPIDPSAVGKTGGPVKRSWTSKDALLYAVGVGAGTDELAFTTENTRGPPQRVLPTFAVISGGGGAPFDKIGSFNPAMLVPGEEGIELFGEIPPEGEIESVGKALGATRRKIRGIVLEQAITQNTISFAIGLAASVGANVFVESVSGIRGRFPPAAIDVCFSLMILLSVLVALISIRKAARVDPVIVFRA